MGTVFDGLQECYFHDSETILKISQKEVISNESSHGHVSLNWSTKIAPFPYTFKKNQIDLKVFISKNNNNKFKVRFCRFLIYSYFGFLRFAKVRLNISAIKVVP